MRSFSPTSLFQSANPDVRILGGAVPGGVAMGLLALLGHASPDADFADGIAARWAVVNAWSILIITALIATQQRCSRFQLALPLSARQVWASQMLALVRNAGLALLAMAVTAALGHVAFGGGTLAPPGLAAMLARIASAFLLGVAILQTRSPALSSIPLRRYWTVGMGIVLGLGTLLAVMGGRWRFDWLAMLGLAAVLTHSNYRRVPSAYALELPVPRPAPATRREKAAVFPLDLQIARWLHGYFMWIYAPVLVLSGFLNTGVTLPNVATHHTWLWFFFALMTMMHVHTFMLNSAHRLGRLSHLPVSRSRLFALTIVPALVAVSLGYAAGGLVREHYSGPAGLQVCSERRECFRVPGRLYEIADTGDVRRLVAPSGEGHELRPQPLFPGSPYGLYSPLETPPGSSTEWVAWQLSRAVEEIYGRSVDPDELQRRYLAPGRDGDVDMGASLAELSRDFGRPPRPASTHVPIGLLFFGAVMLLTLAIAIAATRRLAQGKPLVEALEGGEGAAWVVPVLIGWCVVVAVPMLLSFAHAAPWVLPAFVDVVARKAAAAGWLIEAGLWLTGLGGMLIGYRLAERQYTQLEAQPSIATTKEST